MKPVIVLTGPTGSGKSRVVYDLPEKLPIEVINADSRQIYRYMDIGTAMPSRAEMEKFSHHLFSFLDPSQPFSAGQYASLCKEALEKIHARNHIPVIVGGTFFYIKALWDGLLENIPIPPEIKERVGKLSREDAYNLLREIDPHRGAKLFLRDEHRVKRSLELSLSTNSPISSLTKSGGVFANYTFHSFCLDMNRATLYERINERVKLMFDHGLLKEVANLLALGYTVHDPGLNAIGYKEIINMSAHDHLDVKNWTDNMIRQVIEKTSQASRNFAKRQLTWFRHEDRLKRIDPIHAVSLISEIILQSTKI